MAALCELSNVNLSSLFLTNTEELKLVVQINKKQKYRIPPVSQSQLDNKFSYYNYQITLFKNKSFLDNLKVEVKKDIVSHTLINRKTGFIATSHSDFEDAIASTKAYFVDLILQNNEEIKARAKNIVKDYIERLDNDVKSLLTDTTEDGEEYYIIKKDSVSKFDFIPLSLMQLNEETNFYEISKESFDYALKKYKSAFDGIEGIESGSDIFNKKGSNAQLYKLFMKAVNSVIELTPYSVLDTATLSSIKSKDSGRMLYAAIVLNNFDDFIEEIFGEEVKITKKGHVNSSYTNIIMGGRSNQMDESEESHNIKNHVSRRMKLFISSIPAVRKSIKIEDGVKKIEYIPIEGHFMDLPSFCKINASLQQAQLEWNKDNPQRQIDLIENPDDLFLLLKMNQLRGSFTQADLGVDLGLGDLEFFCPKSLTQDNWCFDSLYAYMYEKVGEDMPLRSIVNQNKEKLINIHTFNLYEAMIFELTKSNPITYLEPGKSGTLLYWDGLNYSVDYRRRIDAGLSMKSRREYAAKAFSIVHSLLESDYNKEELVNFSKKLLLREFFNITNGDESGMDDNVKKAVDFMAKEYANICNSNVEEYKRVQKEAFVKGEEGQKDFRLFLLDLREEISKKSYDKKNVKSKISRIIEYSQIRPTYQTRDIEGTALPGFGPSYMFQDVNHMINRYGKRGLNSSHNFFSANRLVFTNLSNPNYTTTNAILQGAFDSSGESMTLLEMKEQDQFLVSIGLWFSGYRGKADDGSFGHAIFQHVTTSDKKRVLLYLLNAKTDIKIPEDIAGDATVDTLERLLFGESLDEFDENILLKTKHYYETLNLLRMVANIVLDYKNLFNGLNIEDLIKDKSKYDKLKAIGNTEIKTSDELIKKIDKIDSYKGLRLLSESKEVKELLADLLLIQAIISNNETFKEGDNDNAVIVNDIHYSASNLKKGLERFFTSQELINIFGSSIDSSVKNTLNINIIYDLVDCLKPFEQYKTKYENKLEDGLFDVYYKEYIYYFDLWCSVNSDEAAALYGIYSSTDEEQKLIVLKNAMKSYFYGAMFLRDLMNDLTIGRQYKDTFKGKALSIEQEIKERNQNAVKRAISYSSSGDLLMQNKINGVSRDIKVSIIEDSKSPVYNMKGKTGEQSEYDGCGFVSPVLSILENESYGGGVWDTKKTFGTTFFKNIPSSTLYKWAEHILSNFYMRQLSSKYKALALYKRSHDLQIDDINEFDLTKNFLNKPYLNFMKDMLYYYYDNENLSYMRVVGFIKDKDGTYIINSAPVDSEGDFIYQDKTEFRNHIESKKGVKINSLYDIYEAFHGLDCMSYTEKGLLFSECIHDLMATMIINVGRVINEGERFTLDNVYLPLRKGFVSIMATRGAIKNGLANVNSKEGDRNYVFKNSDMMPLNFFTVSSSEFRRILEASEYAEGAKVSEFTQTLSAIAVMGYCHELALLVYDTIAMSIQNALKNTLSAELTLKIVDNLFEEIRRDSSLGIPYVLASVLQLSDIPTNTPYISKTILEDAAAMFNKEIIRRKYNGLPCVLNATSNIVQLLKAGSSRVLYDSALSYMIETLNSDKSPIDKELLNEVLNELYDKDVYGDTQNYRRDALVNLYLMIANDSQCLDKYITLAKIFDLYGDDAYIKEELIPALDDDIIADPDLSFDNTVTLSSEESKEQNIKKYALRLAILSSNDSVFNEIMNKFYLVTKESNGDTFKMFCGINLCNPVLTSSDFSILDTIDIYCDNAEQIEKVQDINPNRIGDGFRVEVDNTNAYAIILLVNKGARVYMNNSIPSELKPMYNEYSFVNSAGEEVIENTYASDTLDLIQFLTDYTSNLTAEVSLPEYDEATETVDTSDQDNINDCPF